MPVIVHVRTGTCRHFKDYDLAVLWLRRRADQMKYLFCGPEDFMRVTPDTREKLWPLFREWSLFRWREDRVPDWDTFKAQTIETQNKTLWILVNSIADRVTVTPQYESGSSNLRVDLEKCVGLLRQTEWVTIDVKAPDLPQRLRKPASQLRTVVELLVENDEMYLTEEEIEELMVSERVSRRMRTRQSTLRIFRYYRPVLEAAGVLT